MTGMQRFACGRGNPLRGSPAAVTAAGASDEADPRRAWLALAAVCLGMIMTFVNITATFGARGHRLGARSAVMPHLGSRVTGAVRRLHTRIE